MKLNLNIESYRNFVFDCDGVVLDTNEIKSKVFYEIALRYTSQENANLFRTYNKSHGGLNRRAKFEFLFRSIMKSPNIEELIDEASKLFQLLSLEKCKNAEITEGLLDFISTIPQESKKYIVSASDQSDLDSIFEHKHLVHNFTGIFGGPESKVEILRKLNLQGRTIFFGDSLVDYKAANHFSFDFVFVRKYSSEKSIETDSPQSFLTSIDTFNDLRDERE